MRVVEGVAGAYPAGCAPTVSERMPRLAMKSAGPKTSASSRAEAAAIASTAARPAASSICASIPMRPGGSPTDCSTWPSSRSSQAMSRGPVTLGSTITSTLWPACSTTPATSR